MRRFALVAFVLGVSATAAHAGGLARPNFLSARGLGLGGAFVAVADDATAWHFNPAGTVFADSSILLGGELVVAPRTYMPLDPSMPEQSPDTPIFPLPALGVVKHVSDRVVLGGGLWNTYGGSLTYPDQGLSQVIDQSRDAVIETVLGVGYRVNERVAIGGSVRLGIGLFSVKATQKPVDTNLSSKGIGVGAALGATWLASEKVTLAASWRSAMNVKTTGTGELMLPSGPLPVNVEHQQTWPQSASVGAAVALGARARWSVELDWTQWSRMESLSVNFPGNEAVNQLFPMDWKDNYAVRTGVEWKKSAGFALRGGAYFDSNAIPDQTIERQYLDSPKFGLSVGSSIGFGAWRLDLGLDGIAGPPRTVPDNSAEVGAFSALRNIAPGDYSGSVFTFEAAAVRRL
jgi:long-chain fatty acid transport protein